MYTLIRCLQKFSHKFSISLPGICIIILSACGGGAAAILASLQYVPAIGGDFCIDTDGDGIDIVNNNCAISANIAIESSGQTTWLAFYDTRLGIFGKVSDFSNGSVSNPFLCTDFIGFVDDGIITTYENDNNQIQSTNDIDPAVDPVCFTGSSVNLNLMRLDTGEEFLFDESDVLVLTEGAWSNIDDTGQTFKFDTSVAGNFTGCEIVGNIKTSFVGSYQPSDINNRIFADFTELRIQRTAGDEVWEGDFAGLSAITLSQPNGSEIRLQRIQDDNNDFNCL